MVKEEMKVRMWGWEGDKVHQGIWVRGVKPTSMACEMVI